MAIGDELINWINYGRSILEDIQDEVTGEIVDTYQAIVDIWEIDCEGSWVLYVKTAVTAAGAALYLVLVPSFEEVLENYLEPKPGRHGSRRGRPDDRDRRPGPRGRGLLYFRPGIPDIDSEIASWLPGAEFLKGRPGAPGEWVFWTAVNTADRVLWYWLLAEVTQTFATKWMSGMMESGLCKQENQGSCQFNTNIATPSMNDNVWANKHTLLNLVEEPIIVGNNGEIVLISGVHIADWMVLVETQWDMTAGNLDTSWGGDVGVNVKAWDALNHVVHDENYTVALAPPKNETVTGFSQATAYISNAARVELRYYVDQTSVNGWTLLAANSKVAAGYRNFRVQ